MKRRTIGLVAVVALTVTALVNVASAGAAGFSAAEYPALIERENTTSLQITSGPISTYCSKKTGQQFPAYGTLNSEGEAVATGAGQNESYTCEGKLFGKSILEFKNCLPTFHPSAPGKGLFDVGQAGCGSVILDTAEKCDYSFGPATNLPAEYSNQSDSFGSFVQVHSSWAFAYTAIGSGCSETGEMAFDVTWQMKAKNEGGSRVDLNVETDGFSFAGGTFEAEAYPLTVSGEQDATKTHTFTIGPNTIRCTKAHLVADQLLAAATQLTLFPEYRSCTATRLGIVFTAEIEEEGCHYVFHGGGTADLLCEEGWPLEIWVKTQNKNITVCHYRLTSQSGREGISYSTVGEGTKRGVRAELDVKGIEFTVVSGSESACGKTGAIGRYTGATTLLGPSS